MPSPFDHQLAALFADQDGLVSRLQAEQHGLNRAKARRLLRLGVLAETVPGVLRLTGVPGSWRQSLRAITLAAPDRAVVSHRAAAALHELDGFVEVSVDGPLEVSVERPHHVRLSAVVHEVQSLAAPDLTHVHGIPVTGLARTLADLGSVVPVLEVERALDDARRRGVSLAWLRQTAERLHRPGQRGTRTLLNLLDEAEQSGRARDSWFEKLVESCLAVEDLPGLRRQHTVRDGAGRFVARIDVAFPSLRLGVEAHSRQFHFGRAAQGADEDRDHRLARAGWEVLYVGWQSATRRPAELLALVREVAQRRRELLGELRSAP